MSAGQDTYAPRRVTGVRTVTRGSAETLLVIETRDGFAFEHTFDPTPKGRTSANRFVREKVADGYERRRP